MKWNEVVDGVAYQASFGKVSLSLSPTHNVCEAVYTLENKNVDMVLIMRMKRL